MRGRRTVVIALATALGMAALLAPASSAAVTVVRASVSSVGVQGNSNSFSPVSVSANGRYAVFRSFADNLVAGDTNGRWDIFVHDLQTGATTQVDVSSAGVEAAHGAPGGLTGEAVSADGRFIVFSSSSANLVPGDTNASEDVFLRDTVSATTRRLSVKPGGAQTRHSSYDPVISSSGRFVAFTSVARFTSGDRNVTPDVYLLDRASGRVSLVDARAGGLAMRAAFGGFTAAAISPDGRYVLFTGASKESGGRQCWVRDTVNNTTHMISRPFGGGPGLGCHNPVMSANDHVIAFQSGGAPRIYLRNRHAHTLTHIAGPGGYSTGDLAISANSRLVVFDSNAPHLVSGDTNGLHDVFVYNRITGTIQRVSLSASGTQANGASEWPGMSADGSVIAFESTATNLVAGDTNASTDIFARRT
jgi:Tol biopolymer transport system component